MREAGDGLVDIGVFAELTGLSADALRHYHDLDLLTPSAIAPGSGYRRYHVNQVAPARRIAWLRSLDMPLPEIRRLIVAGTADDRLGVLLAHRSRLVERARTAEGMVDALDTFIKETFMTDINEDLRLELIEMFNEHQSLAQELFVQTRGGRPDRFLFELPREERPPLYEQAAALAHRHAARLDEVVEKHGWPGVRAAGDDGEAAAWGIAQHADDDNDLCKKWLPLVEQAVRDGDAAGLHFALLTDRVLLRDHRPQRFGTILEPAGSTWRPREPVEDPDMLDDRRGNVGLEPFAVWAASLQSPDAWYQATTAD